MSSLRMVAEARVVSGPHAGKALRVWPAGQMRGDLGEARLNQRAAMYAEALLDKARSRRLERHRKVFEGPDGAVELEFNFEEGEAPQ